MTRVVERIDIWTAFPIVPDIETHSSSSFLVIPDSPISDPSESTFFNVLVSFPFIFTYDRYLFSRQLPWLSVDCSKPCCTRIDGINNIERFLSWIRANTSHQNNPTYAFFDWWYRLFKNVNNCAIIQRLQVVGDTKVHQDAVAKVFYEACIFFRHRTGNWTRLDLQQPSIVRNEKRKKLLVNEVMAFTQE